MSARKNLDRRQIIERLQKSGVPKKHAERALDVFLDGVLRSGATERNVVIVEPEKRTASAFDREDLERLLSP